MSIIKITDFEKNTENPFLKQSIEQVEKNVVKKYKTATNTEEKAILKAYDENTGEVLGHTQFIRKIEVDEDQFTKIYLENFQQFFNLKTQSIRVFGYIMTRLKPNQDYFYFDLDECKEYTGYKSQQSVYNGLGGLISNEIIARGKKDSIYYINPMVFFNGNRIAFTKMYVKKSTLSAGKNLP